MDLDLIFFGGKGGVGKSTTSAATAAYLAKLNPEKKILLISFDIAHNLSDIFNMEIGDKETKVLDNLWVIEPDADRYTEEFVKVFVEKAKELAYMAPLVKKITNLEQYIEESFSAASIPLAVKNSIFFEEIITKSNIYDVFVVDMPPTGNMISIFEIPKTTMQVFLKSTLETMDKVMDFMQTIRKFNPVFWFKPSSEKRRNIAKELVKMLKELDARGDKIMNMLKHNSSLRFVTIAERPSYEEIKRAAKLVEKYTRLDGVVINKIVPDGIDCRFCRKETEYQKKYISLIEETFHGKKIWKGYKLEEEAIGLDRILAFAKDVYQTEKFDEIVNPRLD
nr:TRC40/GET3/ArsA family transport-energizing ATPase [Candidatus Sigynarchaeota archaeon]